MRNTFCALALAASLVSGAAHATQPPAPAQNAAVVWNQGFGTGATGLDWSDLSDGQNMTDSVTLAHTTAITGYNFYTASDLSGQTGSADFNLRVWSDAGGTPSAQLVSENIGFTASNQVCSGCVPGGWDAFELNFSFAPIDLQAGTTYWVGISGNGFDADMVSVLGVQDDSMAQFNGDSFDFIATGANGQYTVGDQMFQLLGTAVPAAVPEPANIALVGAGLLVLLLGATARRRRG